jgi:hypothetical protein
MRFQMPFILGWRLFWCPGSQGRADPRLGFHPTSGGDGGFAKGYQLSSGPMDLLCLMEFIWGVFGARKLELVN